MPQSHPNPPAAPAADTPADPGTAATPRTAAGPTALATDFLPTAAERAQAGRAARAATPRSALADVGPEDGRDPLALIERQAACRVAELVPLRHARMSASALSCYRGTALVMAADLATTARTGLTVQLCGDAHLSNFGVFASPERRLLFDINDFDETHPGPFEWDLKRLVASVELAARGNDLRRRERRGAVLAAARAYRETMRALALQRALDVWYTSADVDELLPQWEAGLRVDTCKRSRAFVAKARRRDHRQALGKLTRVVDGERRFVSDPPVMVPASELIGRPLDQVPPAEIQALLGDYRTTLRPDTAHLLGEYHLVDLARRVVGVGSVGTRAWVLLLQGARPDDALVLQAKEAQVSVLAEYVGGAGYEHEGRRVVEGQRLLQAASDIFLGWYRSAGNARESSPGVPRDYYLRQLRDGKGSVVVEELGPVTLAQYAHLCGASLARAHARSGDRVAIAAYLGSSDRADRALLEYAEAYADRAERDYAGLLAAIASGRLAASGEDNGG